MGLAVAFFYDKKRIFRRVQIRFLKIKLYILFGLNRFSKRMNAKMNGKFRDENRRGAVVTMGDWQHVCFQSNKK